MNEKTVKILTDLGLDKKQARIYLACLELGEATVRELAKKTGLKRTGLYYVLDELKKLGVVYKTKVGGRTYFVAEEPEELLRQYKNRTERFSEQLEVIKAFSNKTAKKPRIYFFEGAEGFKKIWQIIYRSGIKEYLIISNPDEMHGFVKKSYIASRIIKEKKKLNIKSRQLISFSELAKEIVSRDRRENRESKMLPHTHKISFTTIIFGNHVALISPHLENIMLIIESEGYAKSQRSIFDTLWQLLPEIKRKF